MTGERINIATKHDHDATAGVGFYYLYQQLIFFVINGMEMTVEADHQNSSSKITRMV